MLGQIVPERNDAMKSNGSRLGVACAAAVLFAGCASAGAGPHETLDATLWVQTSAEYDSVTREIYRSAAARLTEALADSTWTAVADQIGEYWRLPPAVILDVDETFLDNVAYAARLISAGTRYPDGWDDFVNEARAPALAGALEYVGRARRLGVTVFFVTNRDEWLEDGTRRNLEAVGFRPDSLIDTVLMRGEIEAWGSDKTSRRVHVAASYRVLALLGDDLNDFLAANRLSREDRDAAADSHASDWGRKWFMLPNPTYGGWMVVLTRGTRDLSEDEEIAVKRDALDPD